MNTTASSEGGRARSRRIFGAALRLSLARRGSGRRSPSVSDPAPRARWSCDRAAPTSISARRTHLRAVSAVGESACPPSRSPPTASQARAGARATISQRAPSPRSPGPVPDWNHFSRRWSRRQTAGRFRWRLLRRCPVSAPSTAPRGHTGYQYVGLGSGPVLTAHARPCVRGRRFASRD